MNKLKELRNNRGITLRDLSAEVGIVNSTLSEIENGKRPMGPTHARRLAKFFNVSEDYIMGGDSVKVSAKVARYDFKRRKWQFDDLLKDSLDEMFDSIVQASVSGTLDDMTRLTIAAIDDILHHKFTKENLQKILDLINELKGDWK